MSNKKKRVRATASVFSAIQELDSEDVRAAHKKRVKTSNEVRKTKAAQSQVALYKHLMECRILLQKSLDGTDKSNNNLKACNQVLLNLLEARNKLCSFENNDYANAVQQDSNNLETILEKEYSECRAEWKEVLNRRHKDLRLHTGLTAKNQFKVMDSSFWQQVQATVSHEEALDKKEFDDTKVYQHQLAEFLSSTSGQVEKQKRRALQNKKKQVDRKASKGRKIRYMVHPKLVNFTFPVTRPASSSGMDENEWFQSLFGGAGNNNK